MVSSHVFVGYLLDFVAVVPAVAGRDIFSSGYIGRTGLVGA